MALNKILVGDAPNSTENVDSVRTAYEKTNLAFDVIDALPLPPSRKTAAAFTTENPVLALNQIGYETDTGKIKIGDGATHWADLPYSGGGESGGGGAPVGQTVFIDPDTFFGDDVARVNAAYAQAVSSGYPVRFGRWFDINAALDTVSLTETQTLHIMRGPGGLSISANNERPMVVEAVWPTPVSVSALTLTTRTFPGSSSGATECTKLTAAGHGCAVGDLVKIVAEDAIPGEINASRRVGEWGKIMEVDGNDLYVGWRPADPFTTGIRLQRVPTGAKFIADGLRIKHTAGQSWTTNALTLRGLVRPSFVVEVRDGYSCAVQLQSCALIERGQVAAVNMLNRISSLGISGYGVQDCGGCLNDINVSGSDNCRHAYTTGSLSVPSDGSATYLYGRTIACTSTGKTIGCSAASQDLHSSALSCTLYNASSSGGIIGEDSSGSTYQLRGRKNRVVDGVSLNCPHGLQFWAQVAGDGEDNEAINFQCSGYGDAIRVGAESGVIVKRARVIGGRSSQDNIRHIYAASCEDFRVINHTFAPVGSTSGANALTVNTGAATVSLINCTFDLTNYTGPSFDIVAFSGGLSDCVVTLENPKVIDPNLKLRSWANGNGTVGNTLTLRRLDGEATLSVGNVVNGDDLVVDVGETNFGRDDLASMIDAATTDADPSIGEAIRDSLEFVSPDSLASVEGTVKNIEDAALDETNKGPRLGQAIAAAYATMEQGAILAALQKEAERGGISFAVAQNTGVTTGDIAVFGPVISGYDRIRTLAPVGVSVVAQTPNTFPHFAAVTGATEALSHAAAALLIEAALPYGSVQTVAFSGGLLSYNTNQYRVAMGTMTANGALAATLWDDLPNGAVANLLLAIDGTNRTLTVNAPDAGLKVWKSGGAITALPVTLTANGLYRVQIFKLGNLPMMILSDQGFTYANPLVQVVSLFEKSIVATGNSQTLSFTDKPPHAIGDRIYAFQVSNGGGTPPTKPADFTDMGVATSGSAPGLAVSYKDCTSADEALSGWTSPASNGSGARVALLVARKPGGTVAHGTPGYWKAVGNAGGADTVTWADAILPVRGLFVGAHALVSTDIGEMRSQINLVGTIGTSNRLMYGVSDAKDPMTLASETTDKTGSASRSLTFVLPIY